ncbi:hypothetical protein MOJ79_11115 [Calidifontimicrobium sp. SYSU G02091]|uniref:hypothetical protein n=1 Tax=Calidifontimicrobium sp. SYSU G02091 TaxID=2926421 RepID=UPI001F53C2C2|nr:hypothetical protein [Calidifontimicrobium sp. SYSU G02091]MCI1192393.1 hypothetical protein [Calidifontimicrobium sp. SYSU G02091]
MTTKTLIGATAALAGWPALAHEGHGLPGVSHWHASDVFGVALAVAVLAGLWWFGRRK